MPMDQLGQHNKSEGLGASDVRENQSDLGFSLLSLGYYRHHRELWAAEAHVFEPQ